MTESLLTAPFAQGIGLAGAAFGMAWPLFRSRFGMLMGQLAVNLCFALHYLLLDAWTGCVMNLFAAAQVVAAVPLGTRPRFRLVYLAVLPFIAAGVALTWNGVASAFAALAFGCVSLARYQIQVRPFRVAMAVAFPCWLTHNLLVFSVPGVVSDVVGMTLNLVMLVRLLWPRSRAPSELVLK
ncbi:YgjV family protein [Azospirillum sp.]|uniref:YgjV family protein n=1 Tax=Azospirillum sp. TaxID=34012 RepID=UPI003D730E4B